MKLQTEEKLFKQIEEIRGADAEAMRAASAYVQSLAAPPGSLGKLTDAAVQLAGITGKVKNTLGRRRIIVMCADNGVVEEGVSATPQIVTLSQALNMTRHLTGMSSLAAHFGIDTEIVDIGIATSYQEQGCKILQRRIRRGTGNLAKEPAMTREETVRAILVGIERAGQAAADGIDVIGVGEMGIGNTTTSSAVLAALTGLSVEDVTGRGGGLTDAAFEKKKNVISRALKLHGFAGTASGSASEDADAQIDPVEVLSRVGGLDLAGMCGVYLGAAICRIPAVIDGFISIVAALCAQRLCGSCRDFMFPSHVSEEIGYLRAAQELHLDPWLHLNMRLGEGSGCPLAFQILEASCALMNEMATFEQAQIDDGYLTELRAMQKQ
jgi:nicotinate-nucleotide--dimethylbenzimidazole phosphoribosyltransferase